MTKADVVEQIWKRFKEISDPCSIAIGAPMSLTDLGLVASVDLDMEARQVSVGLSLTDPGCWYYFQMAEAIEDAISGLDPSLHVDVTMSEVVWTEGRMSVSARHLRRSGLEGNRPQVLRGSPTG